MDNAGIERNPTSRGAKGWLALGFSVLFVAAIYLLFFLARDTQTNPPQLIDKLWTARVDNATRVYFVTKEDRSQTRSFDSEGAYRYEQTYSLYTLHACDPKTGVAINATQIARIETTSPDFKKYRAYVTLPNGPGILGAQGDLLWLWNNGLEARNLRTLEPVWTPAKLKELNPEFAPLIPDDPKYTKVLSKLQGLVVKGQDARYFQIDGPTGKIQPLAEAKLGSFHDSKRAQAAFDSLEPQGRSMWSTSLRNLIWSSLTADGWWYALLTADQRTSLTANPGEIDGYYGRVSSYEEAPSTLFRGRFENEFRQALNQNRIKLNVPTVAPVSTESFLQAGFLRRPSTGKVWSVGDGRSYLVIHRKTLGEKSPWHITRLALDGKIVWTRSTNLIQLGEFAEAPGALIITGKADSPRPIGNRPDLVVFIDEMTGESHTLDVVTHELTTGN
jgi:hypothetical protein